MSGQARISRYPVRILSALLLLASFHIPASALDIAVGIFPAETSVFFSLPPNTTARNAGGTFFFPADSTLELQCEGGRIRWFFDAMSPGPSSENWEFSPAGDSPLSINGRAYRGSFAVFLSRDTSFSEPRLAVVNHLPLEDYLRSVVPAEIGIMDSGNLEAVKSQAVAARTYSLRNLGRWMRLGFDLLATPVDQVYAGIASETTLSDSAVAATAGEFLFWESRPILAVYHSTCGGRTLSRSAAWGTPDLPYLQSVSDAVDDTFACAASKYFSWKETYSGETSARIAAPYDTWFLGALRHDSEERPFRYIFYRASASLGDTLLVLEGDQVRKTVPRPAGGWLRSSWFESEVTDSGVILAGRGWGHGIGMCQMGAIGRARRGWGYQEILQHYFPGAVLQKH